MAIKFLVEEGSYRYIMSGSLLGVDVNSVIHTKMLRLFRLYLIIDWMPDEMDTYLFEEE